MKPTEDRGRIFASTRPLLFSIAYRMLGSVADAEDLVQDTWLRWEQARDVEVREPRAYLTTIVTRLAINHLRSARSRRETYVGPWLPEPLVTEGIPGPDLRLELAESLTMAFMVMLERLSPLERAVLLLRDVFDFDYAEIARVVGRNDTNCRQILSRARKRLDSPEPRFEADPAEAERLLDRFTHAATAGDVGGMVALLADDITLWADGGGKVPGAALRPVHGADAVARFAAGVLRRFVPAERSLRVTQMNGEPGFIVYVNGQPHAALVFTIRNRRIGAIYAVGNPDKLRSLPVQ